jgi:hypothetical protein
MIRKLSTGSRKMSSISSALHNVWEKIETATTKRNEVIRGVSTAWWFFITRQLRNHKIKDWCCSIDFPPGKTGPG